MGWFRRRAVVMGNRDHLLCPSPSRSWYRDFFPLWFVICNIPLFLPSLPVVRIHNHYCFSQVTVTDAVISQRLVPSIHPSIHPHLQKENKGRRSVAPLQVSAQILKLIILKVHTANVGLPSVQCEREVPPLTTYWFYLCDLTVPPSQPANIPGGKATPSRTPRHAHTEWVW